ncbi:MAG TPA: ISAs1 family transposase [Candidatus Limnocylindria bacterium]|nr:ISAs1 family transposase [Candidatus Limnocylindria bacterium]
MLHPKKVTLPVADKEKEEVKRTNEIKTAIPLLEAIEIAGKEVSADALLTQRELADYLVTKRKAHYHFTVKGNQPGVLEDLKLYFQDRGEAHFVEHTPPDHGRVETRKIWTTTELNDYLHFPHVAQAFVIERHVTKKKTGESTLDIAYGITSRTPQQADPQRVLQVNRGHCAIGASREGHINQSVKVRPRLKDSGLVAGEASRSESETMKPSDNILGKEYAQHTRLQRAVNADVASLHEKSGG